MKTHMKDNTYAIVAQGVSLFDNNNNNNQPDQYRAWAQSS